MFPSKCFLTRNLLQKSLFTGLSQELKTSFLFELKLSHRALLISIITIDISVPLLKLLWKFFKLPLFFSVRVMLKLCQVQVFLQNMDLLTEKTAK